MSDDFNPVVYEGQRHGDGRYVEIQNIYASHYADMLYLYDPENPPLEISSGETSGKTLSISWDHAQNILTRLKEILGED